MTTELETKKPPSNPTALLHRCCVSLSKSLHHSELSIPFQGVRILLFLLQSTDFGSSEEMNKGPDFQNILSAAQKTLVYSYPTFPMEKTEAQRGEAACSSSHSASETVSGLEPRVSIPSSELSLSKYPRNWVTEVRQTLFPLGRWVCLPVSG